METTTTTTFEGRIGDVLDTCAQLQRQIQAAKRELFDSNVRVFDIPRYQAFLDDLCALERTHDQTWRAAETIDRLWSLA